MGKVLRSHLGKRSNMRKPGINDQYIDSAPKPAHVTKPSSNRRFIGNVQRERSYLGRILLL